MRNSRSGFTLVELMIVIAIISILTGVGMANYFGLRQQSQVNVMAERIVSDMRSTMSRSASQENGQQWGMHFDNTTPSQAFYSIWYGGSYATATTVDRRFFSGTPLVFNIPAKGTSTDIIFAKPYGLPSASTTISISSASSTRIITIDQNGTITY